MKIRFVIPALAILLFAASSFAQSTLSLVFFDKRPFTIEMDGKDYGYMEEEFYAVLDGGTYYVKIYDAVRASVRPVFEGKISIPEKSSTFALINSDFKYEVFKLYKHREVNHVCNCDCEYCRNCIYKDKGGRRHNEYNENNLHPMGDREFSDLTASVQSLAFDDNKREMINMAIDKNYFTSDQVKSLLGLFSFEASKLEIAKNAYRKTIDKENYFKVSTAFTFESTIMELKEFLNKQK